MLRSEEPDAGNPHVRICGSPGLATARGHPTVFRLLAGWFGLSGR